MIQGSTPLHTFVLPFSTELIHSVRVTYEQKNKIVLSKETNDVAMEGNTIALRLSQDETLLFDSLVPARIQLHILTTGGDALPSKPKTVPVYVLLDKRVIL